MNQTVINERFKILKKLNEGGFGQTFIVEDIKNSAKPKYVIKKLRPQGRNSQVFKIAHRLFQQETKVLYHLGQHEQIPTLIQDFQENGEFYLVQEYIEGKTLQQELDEGKVFNQNEVIDLLEQILRVLSYVHSENVIHRDIKPSNIIRRKSDGKLVLIDFGAVKQVRSKISIQENGYSTATVAIGSNGYMATEQLAGHPRYSSDIYSAGMLAIQLLTGIHPMRLQQSQQTGEWIWSENIVVDNQLEKIIKKMVFYDFRQRYDLAIIVVNELKKLKSSNSIPNNKPALSQSPQKFVTNFDQNKNLQAIPNQSQNNFTDSTNQFVSANTGFDSQEENIPRNNQQSRPNFSSKNDFQQENYKTSKNQNTSFSHSAFSGVKVVFFFLLLAVIPIVAMVYSINTYVEENNKPTLKTENKKEKPEMEEYVMPESFKKELHEQYKIKPLKAKPLKYINGKKVNEYKKRRTSSEKSNQSTPETRTYPTRKPYSAFDEALKRKKEAIKMEQNMSTPREILDARYKWWSASSSFGRVKREDSNYTRAQQEEEYCNKKSKYLFKVWKENSKRLKQEKKEKEKRESVYKYLDTSEQK